jgi:uncharacterized membrane protein YoaK (UPF0700 family)
MRCRNCGTEIADKALICYRCGVAVAEPIERPPAPRPSRQRPTLAALALVVLVLAALFMGRTVSGEVPRLLSWLVLVLALVVAVWRVAATRRDRRR